MDTEGQHEQIHREELYRKVWSKPVAKLAAELGISGVALAKRCKKLNIPRPPRGYWAKRAAGHRIKKTPLPPIAELPRTSVQTVGRRMPDVLPLPKSNERLHCVSSALIKAIEETKAGANGLIRVEDRLLPRTKVTEAMAHRTAGAFHAILMAVESRGIRYRKSRSKYDGAYFEKNYIRLEVRIEEISIPREPTTREMRMSLWQRTEACLRPTGRLRFTASPNRYGRVPNALVWSEDDKHPLERITAQVAAGVCHHFREVERERKEEEEKRKKEHEEWLRRQRAEQMRMHNSRVADTPEIRTEDLIYAAEWQRLYMSTLTFIEDCRSRWLSAQNGELRDDQQHWIDWARSQVKQLSPFEAGYPDPILDGPFNPEDYPFGGPVPPVRKFPRPPTMPVILTTKENGMTASHRSSQPYPFWLRHEG